MENSQQSLIQKPVGIYILTICIFLRFGVFQFINDFNAIREAEKATPLLITVILISRNVFVAGAAIWAYLGDNEGRISLLAIVSLNVLWTVFSIITFISYSENNSNLHFLLDYLLNPIFWLVICWWYLNRKNVVKYYKR